VKALYLRDALPGDTWLMVPDIRQADVDELAALGVTPEQCLRFGIQLSERATTIYLHGEPAGIVGVIDYGEYRLPWACFTTAIDKYPIPFLRGAMAWMRGVDGLLMNYVDARNDATIRWLKWLGFTVDDPEPYGINGEPFHRFWKGVCAG
jgi:hypothetical protein